MSEIKVVTTDPNPAVYKDGVLLTAAPPGGGNPIPPTVPDPPGSGRVEVISWPAAQYEFHPTIGDIPYTVRTTVPLNVQIKPNNTGFFKVVGYPSEHLRNRQYLINGVVVAPWYPPPLTTVLQDDFVVLPAGQTGPWGTFTLHPGDTIDYQFKDVTGVGQVLFSLATPTRY